MEENIGTDIVALNRDVEPALLALTGLTFVHTADMHGMPTLWARMVRYIDHYADKIAFALHTGDYCGGYQGIYTDMYAASPCRRPIYNCVGNHDCFPGGPVWYLGEKAVAHGLLFNLSRRGTEYGNHPENCGHSVRSAACGQSRTPVPTVSCGRKTLFPEKFLGVWGLFSKRPQRSPSFFQKVSLPPPRKG